MSWGIFFPEVLHQQVMQMKTSYFVCPQFSCKHSKVGLKNLEMTNHFLNLEAKGSQGLN